MAQFRPAGLSDEDSDSDDYGPYEKPTRLQQKYLLQKQDRRKTNELDLQDAILNGNLQEVERILTQELNQCANLKLGNGWTPLMHACFHAQEKVVKYLLDNGADPNLHADSVTPIMAACSNSGANNDSIYIIVCHLLEKQCILNIGDKYGQTPLMRAINGGRVAVVQKLLEKDVNIEMRDQQGWTALFWAVHHNQPEILELLIAKGARLTEVDKYSRTPLELAEIHDFQNIVAILHNYVKKVEEVNPGTFLYNQIRSWQEYYPSVKSPEQPPYAGEIPHLLYGMNCERLSSLIYESGIDLRTFLLMEEKDMIKMGIEMPYERQRLVHGIRKFHLKDWKINAVAGLGARKVHNYGILDCLTALGTHLQQIYILDATLEYTLRDYNRIQDKIKYEPPDSPFIKRMKTAAKKLVNNINCIRKEIKILRGMLTQISKSNPPPADLIKEKPTREIIIGYVTDAVIICCLGFFAFQARSVLLSR